MFEFVELVLVVLVTLDSEEMELLRLAAIMASRIMSPSRSVEAAGCFVLG